MFIIDPFSIIYSTKNIGSNFRIIVQIHNTFALNLLIKLIKCLLSHSHLEISDYLLSTLPFYLFEPEYYSNHLFKIIKIFLKKLFALIKNYTVCVLRYFSKVTRYNVKVSFTCYVSSRGGGSGPC